MNLDKIQTNILTAVLTVLVGGIGMIVYDHFTTDTELEAKLRIEQRRTGALEQMAAQGVVTVRKLTEVATQNSRSLTSLATGRAADTLERNYKLIAQFEAKYGDTDFADWNEQDQSRYLASQAAIADAIALVTNGL